LEQLNNELTTTLADRNQELGQVRGELASLSRGASGGGLAVRASESAALEGSQNVAHSACETSQKVRKTLHILPVKRVRTHRKYPEPPA
jgi:hypothetical protein